MSAEIRLCSPKHARMGRQKVPIGLRIRKIEPGKSLIDRFMGLPADTPQFRQTRVLLLIGASNCLHSC